MSTQYPGYGGGSTNAYAIIKALRAIGYRNTIGVYFEDRADAVVDPDQIGDIYRVSLYPFMRKHQQSISNYKAYLQTVITLQPCLIICKDYLTSSYSKILYPHSKVLYLMPGLENVINHCVTIPASLEIELERALPTVSWEETGVHSADYVVVNSALSHRFFSRDYHLYRSKLHSVPINTTGLGLSGLDNVQHYPNRDYDFVIVSSILTRPEKNNLFLLPLINHPMMADRSFLVVGNDGSDFENLPNVDLLSLIPRDELLELFTQCKIILHPAFYDSNPNCIQEAIYLGCLPLVSNNIGRCEIYPEECVCTDYQIETWIVKALHLLQDYQNIKNKITETVLPALNDQTGILELHNLLRVLCK